MERLKFTNDVAFTPPEELLERVAIAPLTTPIAAGSPVQAAIFRIEAGGRIRRHPATYPQILAVLEGEGEVSAGEGTFEAIAAGEAVYWTQGEEHETRTAEGLTALVLEAPALEPFIRRQ